MPSGPAWRTFAAALGNLPLSLLTSLRDLLAYVLRLLWGLLRLLWELLHGRAPERYEELDCAHIPPEVNRRPDPCLYSQSFLAAQGVAVTWDNPDIRLTDPNGVPVPSTELTSDTDYIVVATIHNASFDPAIGVTVRSYFRGWGVDFDDRTPAEVDANGDAAERIVHIGAWGQATVSFKWHTPAEAGHYCISIECHHPADREPANNVGQENTDVVQASPGSSARIVVPFFNRRQRVRAFRIEVDEYEIPDGRVELTLEPVVEKRTRERKMEDEDTRRALIRDALRGSRIRLVDGRRARLGERYELFGYSGREGVIAASRRGDFELTEDWVVTLPGRELTEGQWQLPVAPGATEEIEVVVAVPERSAPGDRKVLNVTARDQFGAVVGGVTVLVQVVEAVA